MKRLLTFILMLGIFSLACQTLMPTPAPNIPPTLEPVEPSLPGIDMDAKLEELGGTPCEETPELTCVSIEVPLNHFDAANTETIHVVFGVRPASGERYGMYVQAFPGGPGGEGISSAYLDYFSEEVLDHFDIVFYDQRGIGLSNPLECPVAFEKDFIRYLTEVDNTGEEGFDTPEEQQAATDDARTYIEECVAEIGIDSAKLAFFGTDQVAEDIESFRAIIGDEKFWLYGVSYGTAVSQTYAAAHRDRLAGLILDGTINMTRTGADGALSQEKAFDKVLLAILNACNDDEACSADMGGEDAVAVYDKLAAKTADKPIPYEFPLPSGEKVKGSLTFNQLEYTVAYQMYTLTSRMIFLKALAAANKGDLIPMMRLMYENTVIDPANFDYLGDPTFSDTMFLGVLCTDDAYFSGTQEERIAQTIEAGQASNGTVPRLDGSIYTGLSCAFWPASPKEEVKREPLTLEGVPTFVLNATLDPATPFEEGEAVYKNLADGYHVYVEGGIHSIYGWGYECPDNLITDFLVDGKLPAQRETVCTDWEKEPFSFYSSNLPAKVSDFEDPMDLMTALDDNFYYLPEAYYGDWLEYETIGCTYGGSFTFGPSDDGSAYTYDQCAMMPGLVVTGTSSYSFSLGIFTTTLEISGDKTGKLTYNYNYQTRTTTLTGEFDGESVNLTR